MLRAISLIALLVILSACGSTPVTSIPPTVTPPPATPTPSPIPATPTPAAVWQQKLSGLWEQQTDIGVAEWMIDVEGGSISSRTYGGDSVKIEVEREEEQTVYILLRGLAGDRHDSFRFVGDDVVIWQQGQDSDATEITLERK